MSILSQIANIFDRLTNNFFYIDQCPARPDLVGVRGKFLSNGSGTFKFLNTIDDEIEEVSSELECVISAE